MRHFTGKQASFGRIGYGKGFGQGRRESGLHSTLVLLAPQGQLLAPILSRMLRRLTAGKFP